MGPRVVGAVVGAVDVVVGPAGEVAGVASGLRSSACLNWCARSSWARAW